MRSTGEVMGVGDNFGEAFAKAQLAPEHPSPTREQFSSASTRCDKHVAAEVARRFHELRLQDHCYARDCGGHRERGRSL